VSDSNKLPRNKRLQEIHRLNPPNPVAEFDKNKARALSKVAHEQVSGPLLWASEANSKKELLDQLEAAETALELLYESVKSFRRDVRRGE